MKRFLTFLKNFLFGNTSSKTWKYLRSFLLFLLISAASILGVMLFYKGGLDFTHVTWHAVIIAGALSLSSLYFETERVRLIARTMKERIPYKPALESVMGREFLSAITPFGSGGQPLGIYILTKYGFKLGFAITISYLETFYSLLMLFLGGLISLIFYSEVLQSSVLIWFLVWSFGAMLYFFFFSYFSISKPKLLKKIGLALVNFLHRVKIIKPHKLHTIKIHIIREIQVFNQHIHGSIRSHWLLIIGMFLVTFILWVLRFAAIYPIVLALGYNISLIELVAYQMIITSVNYFSFTPGSSGTTDWLGAALFGIFIVNKDSIPTFITLWRFFSYHIIIFVCGIVIFRVVHLFGQQKKTEGVNK